MEVQYPVNDHARAMLGLGPQFVEPVNNDIPSNPDANKSYTEDDEPEDDEAEDDDKIPALED